MAAGIGLVRRHVADAGLDRGVDFAWTQSPEMALRGAHVRPHLVFDVLRQAHQVGQAGQRAWLDAECGREPVKVRLTVGLGRGHLGRTARSLQCQQFVQLGAFAGRAARRRRREDRHERRHVAVKVVRRFARQ